MNFHKKFFLNFAILILFSINLSAQEVKTENELKTFLDEKEILFDDISVQMGIASWNIYSEEDVADTQTPRLRYLDLFTDKKLNSVIDYWSAKLNDINDGILKRRVEVWSNILLGAKIDNDKSIFPLEDQLEKWLADNESTAPKPSADSLEILIVELMKRRNEKAKEFGFNNYAELQFKLNDININDFYAIVEEVEKATLPKYLSLRNEVLSSRDSQVFEFSDAMKMISSVYRNKTLSKIDSKIMDSVITSTYSDIGIDYKSLPIRMVEKEILFGGNGLAIKIPTDFRIVVKNNQPISVWMHELGHGLQAVFTEIESPILKGYEWCLGNSCAAFGEGMAETSAKFSSNEQWLKQYVKAEDKDIAKKDSIFYKYAPAYLRYQLLAITLEIELYKNLDRNPDMIRDSLFNKYFLIEKSNQPTFKYQNNAIYVSYPVYLHNYFIADIISSQIHNSLKKNLGKDYIHNKSIGKLFRTHLYQAGELIKWRDKIKSITGKDLDIKEYLSNYGI